VGIRKASASRPRSGCGKTRECVATPCAGITDQLFARRAYPDIADRCLHGPSGGGTAGSVAAPFRLSAAFAGVHCGRPDSRDIERRASRMLEGFGNGTHGARR